MAEKRECSFIVPFGTKDFRVHFLKRRFRENSRAHHHKERCYLSTAGAIVLGAATLTTPTSAEARYWHGGGAAAGVGPAVVIGLALGAFAAFVPGLSYCQAY